MLREVAPTDTTRLKYNFGCGLVSDPYLNLNNRIWLDNRKVNAIFPANLDTTFVLLICVNSFLSFAQVLLLHVMVHVQIILSDKDESPARGASFRFL